VPAGPNVIHTFEFFALVLLPGLCVLLTISQFHVPDIRLDFLVAVWLLALAPLPDGPDLLELITLSSVNSPQSGPLPLPKKFLDASRALSDSLCRGNGLTAVSCLVFF